MKALVCSTLSNIELLRTLSKHLNKLFQGVAPSLVDRNCVCVAQLLKLYLFCIFWLFTSCFGSYWRLSLCFMKPESRWRFHLTSFFAKLENNPSYIITPPTWSRIESESWMSEWASSANFFYTETFYILAEYFTMHSFKRFWSKRKTFYSKEEAPPNVAENT